MIMQNKANFSKPKMSATICEKKDYEKRPYGQSGKNKPKQSQSVMSRWGFSEWLLPVDIVFV
jgi:hypothetical protein